VSKADINDSAQDGAEQTEALVGRREALTRFVKYTPPAMLGVLISAGVSKKAFAIIS
jgi:hypothetical protein